MRLRLILLLVGLPFLIRAQDSSVGNWLMYFGNQKINDRWNWHNEIQYRSYNFAGDLEQLLLRTGIGYNLSANNNNLLLGYAFIHGKPYVSGTDEKNTVDEHRIFQQFISKQQFGRVYLQHRYRIEERFVEDDFKMRFRYFLGINLPLNATEMAKNTIYLSLYNEIFLQPQSPVFDRDRLYGALGYVFNAYLRAEAGFMTQLYEASSRGQIQVAFYNNLPFYRGEPR